MELDGRARGTADHRVAYDVENLETGATRRRQSACSLVG